MKYYFYTLEVNYPNWTSKYNCVSKGKSIAHALKEHIDSEKGRKCRIICFEEISKEVYDELNKKEWFA